MAELKYVTGTVRHTDGEPFRHVTVEIWDRDTLMEDRMAVGETDADGRFQLAYDPDKAGWRDLPDLKIKILQPDGRGDMKPIHEQDGPDDLEGDYDFGEISVAHWEYDPDLVVPLILTNALIKSPQSFVLPQRVKLTLAAMPLNRTHEAHKKKGNAALTLAEVQKDYGANMTMNHADSRSDAFQVDAILNGFNPALFTQDGDGKYHVRYGYDAYTFDGVHQIPNVHAVLSQQGDGLQLEQIEYRVRRKDAVTVTGDASFEAPVQSRPGDAGWEQAKLYFRIAEFLDGQAKGHLGRAHLNMGQYAIAMYRNLRKNPLLQLLNPHLRGVTPINDTGKGVIFGETGVLAVLSPLTADSLLEVMRDDLGQCDWLGWAPRAPICKAHRYAHIQQQYWKVVCAHVDRFFNNYGAQIARNWEEVYYFSQDLVRNAPAYRPAEVPAGERWYDTQEISDKPGADKAVSSVTDTPHNPPDADMARLKQLCAYVIFHCSLWHCWRNDNQVNYGGEVDYARLALDYEPVEASFQLMVVHLLVNVKHGYVVKNEDGDIPRDLITALQGVEDLFGVQEYAIDAVRSRINI